MLTSQKILQTQVQGKELLEVEKQVKYRGTTQVRLERLLFKESRELDRNNLERLKVNFRIDHVDSGITEGLVLEVVIMDGCRNS